ncbi:efflux RND transporter permease subunit [Candidatus Roizmanbacteria bacterium]|nr:efflux RND transporter permease subunit [Candidatus Roizmanbacteria bacterium]
MPKQKKQYRSYFDLLRFDPKLRNTFLARYVINIRVVTLFILTITIFGIWGFISLPRRLNPEIDIPIVFIGTMLPGAGPEDVETLVTIPLENAIQSVPNVRNITSTSRESFSSVVVEFENSVNTELAKNDIQSAVDESRGDLPEDASTSSVAALDFEDVPVWTFAIVTDADTASLSRFSEVLEKRIEDVPSVNTVVVTGLERQEIQVLVDPEKMAELAISPVQISQALQSEVSTFPVGSVRSNGYTFPVSIDPLVDSIDSIRVMTFKVNDRIYSLSDVAAISEKSSPNQTTSLYSKKNGPDKRTVTFSVFKLRSADIDAASEEVRAVVDEVVDEFDNRFTVASTSDQGQLITDQFNDLIRNLAQTILLVFLVMFLFLGIRQAAIASLVIPLAFLITFAVMQVTGITLNFLSMFSLILALGMLVDTAVVVISAMTTYYGTKKFTPQETGILVWKDFFAPLLTSTATTIWAFLPLLLATGIIGSFIRTIPIVVSTTLISSTLISLLITLPLMVTVLQFRMPGRVRNFFLGLAGGLIILLLVMYLQTSLLLIPIIACSALVLFFLVKLFPQVAEEASSKLQKHYDVDRIQQVVHRVFYEGYVSAEKISRKFESILRRILMSRHWRRTVFAIVILFFVFSVLLLPLGFVKNIFFPSSDEDYLYVSIEYPSGNTFEHSAQAAMPILAELKTIDDIDFIITEVGRQPMETSTDTQAEANTVLFTLLLSEDREQTSIELAQRIRDQFEQYAEGKVTVIEISGGPPVGAAISIELSGDDLTILHQYADRVVNYLNEQPGVVNVEKSIKPGISKLAFVPDRNELAEYGITVDQIGLWLRTYLSGFTLDQAKITTDDDQDIIFRFYDADVTPEQLGQVLIPVQGQESVPLLSLGKIQVATNPTLITRNNDERTLSVNAGVEAGVNSVEIGSQLGTFVEEELRLPEGYTWSTAGVNEENQESVQSILMAMVLAFVLILATMVMQFRSYRKAVIVMLVIPLALSGVFVLFALTGTPLSFPALIGLLALFGIVVNNSIMIVEKINQNLEMGMSFTDALAEGTANRVEPIMLTSLTTIIGLIPITLSDPFWNGLGGAIIAGLVFSGSIALFFVPLVYYMMFVKEYESTR